MLLVSQGGTQGFYSPAMPPQDQQQHSNQAQSDSDSLDWDPYAPRTSTSYAQAAARAADAEAVVDPAETTTFPSPPHEQNDGRIPGVGSAGPSSSSSSSSSSKGKQRAPPPRAAATEETYDEPLFGGTPFSSSQDQGLGASASGGRDSGGYADPSGGAAGGPDGAASSSSSSLTTSADEFYALLNVDKSATEEQIKEAYRALAVVLHPDKHSGRAEGGSGGVSKKSAAEQHFRRVQRAYEVLSDAERRGVYDHFGEAGLAQNWKVSLRGGAQQTPAELRAQFEREALKRRTREAEDLIKSRGDFTAQLDATTLFAAPHRIPRPAARKAHPVTFQDRWARVGVSQLIGTHSFETQVDQRNVLNLTGQMMSRGGLGGGNLVGTVKTQWSAKFGSEVSLALIRPHIFTTKGTYAIDPNT